MIYAFLAYQTFSKWITVVVINHVVSWLVGITLTFVILPLVLKPMVRRVKAAFRAHLHQQRQIANALDTSTPGGLADVVDALNSRASESNDQRKRTQ